MTTISLLDTEHRTFQHEGAAHISQAAFDVAIERWIEALGRDNTDVDSIHDGSEDVTYALAWRDEGNVVLTRIVQFIEAAGGYLVDDLPFHLEVETEPEAATLAPASQQFFVTITGAAGEIYPADLRAGIHGSMFRDDTVVDIVKGATW